MDITNKLLLELLPYTLRNRLIEISNAMALERKDMLLLQHLSETFIKFQNDQDIKIELFKLVKTDHPENIYFSECRGETIQIQVHERNVTIPCRFIFDMIFQMEGKDLTISAKIFVDIERLYNLIRTLGEEAEKYIAKT